MEKSQRKNVKKKEEKSQKEIRKILENTGKKKMFWKFTNER